MSNFRQPIIFPNMVSRDDRPPREKTWPGHPRFDAMYEMARSITLQSPTCVFVKHDR